MKAYLITFLFICTTLQAQNNFSQSTENQIDYFKSNFKELRDENGKNILNPSTLDSIVFYGTGSFQNYGYSVSDAGDVNGDGFSDIVIGEIGFDSSKGRVYIYFGGNNINNVADVILTGENRINHFGISVSCAGDVNGDGYSDIIVGASAYNNYTGRTYIFYGGLNMNNVADVIMTGESFQNYFGSSVSSAGDVNGDSFDDVIVGATGYSSSAGRAYIYLGGVNMNNVVDVTINGNGGVGLGKSVSTAGDVNNDGFSDVIVGGSGYSNSKGRAYVFYGGTSMNNIADITMTGETNGDQFGWSVSTAGDVNNDGYSDIIVSAMGYLYNTGRVYMFYGDSLMDNLADVIITGPESSDAFGCSVANSGDINRDGFSDIIIGAETFGSITGFNIGRAFIFYGGTNMNNIADIILPGRSNFNYGVGNSVSTAGDFNGDGYLDIIIGAYSGDGRAYLYYNLIPKPKLLNPNNNSLNNPLTINFKWNKLNTSIYYLLVVSTDSAFTNIIVIDTLIADTSKIVSGFNRDTIYYWMIKAKDSSGVIVNSLVWNFKTVPPIQINLKLLIEGIYSPVFNQLVRRDSVTTYLRQSISPYLLIDSAKSTIDSSSNSGFFQFDKASSGSYYIVTKHFNTLETWSKSGGENIVNDGTIYYYDFTTSNTQAYGNNLKLKGTKYCLYSGDVNQDGDVNLIDVLSIYNDATSFVTGRYLTTDLTGDNIVDLTDVTLCYNNSTNFIRVRRP